MKRDRVLRNSAAAPKLHTNERDSLVMQSRSIIVPIGFEFGRLKVVGPEEGKKDTLAYPCECSCGTSPVRSYRKKDLKSGKSTSCGCIAKAKCSTRMKTRNNVHGMRHFPEYGTWRHMIQRCHNPANPCYADYGGRGIFVAEEFRTNFKTFYEHVGPNPGDYWIGRIDNEKGYERGNIRWETPRQQANNRRGNVKYEMDGKTQSIADWAEEYGKSRISVQQRLWMGWHLKDALTWPTRKYEKRSYVIENKD